MRVLGLSGLADALMGRNSDDLLAECGAHCHSAQLKLLSLSCVIQATLTYLPVVAGKPSDEHIWSVLYRPHLHYLERPPFLATCFQHKPVSLPLEPLGIRFVTLFIPPSL